MRKHDGKLTRRDFLRMMGVAAGGTALAACSPTASSPTAPPAATGAPTQAEQVSLRFTTWDAATGAGVYNAVIDKFKAEHPNIDVATEFTPDGYDDQILTGLATGSAPDVFLWWNHPKLVAAGGVVSLDSYVAADNLDLSIYYPSVLEMNKYDGMLVGMPVAFTPRAIFFNKTVFDAAGVDHPTNDWTWDDFLEIAKALTKGEGQDAQYGFFTYTGSYPLQGYVWSNGGDFVSPDGKKATGYMDSPETIQAVQWWADLATVHKVAPTPEAASLIGNNSDMFKNGKLGMMDNGRWPQTDFMATEGLDLGTVMIPKAPGTGKQVPVLHEASYCLAKNGQNKEAAWALAKYMGSEPSQRAFAEAGWGIPATTTTGDALGMTADPIEKTWFDSIPLATVKSCFMRTTVWEQVDALIGPALESIMAGQVTAEEKLKELAIEADTILASVG